MRRHKWGFPGGGGAVPADVKDGMRREAQDDAARRIAGMSAAERAKYDAVVAEVAEASRLRRRQQKDLDAAIDAAHVRGDAPGDVQGMVHRLEAEHKAERDAVHERFAAERERLEDMLDPEGAEARKARRRSKKGGATTVTAERPHKLGHK